MSEGLSSVVSCRYTIMSGTPEKILEHLLEMMRLDAQFTESGTRPPPRCYANIITIAIIIRIIIIHFIFGAQGHLT